MQQNVPLSKYSTMRLGGIAAYVTEVTSRIELEEALAWAQERDLPIIMIGGGSNIIWKDEGFDGLIIVNKIMRFEEQTEARTTTLPLELAKTGMKLLLVPSRMVLPVLKPCHLFQEQQALLLYKTLAHMVKKSPTSS